MIFVTVGSQKFQFNRLLQEIDRLIEESKLAKNIFAQIGYSTYKPKYYSYKEFLNKQEFLNKIEKSTLIISHGGTGSIINALKKGKKVIGVPRMKEYGEHVDNHQFEILEEFSKLNMIVMVNDIKDLYKAIIDVERMKFRKYQSNTDNIINLIEDFLFSIK